MARNQSWKNYLTMVIGGGILLINSAAVQAAPAELSLDDSVASALKNNVAIKIKIDDSDKAKWSIKEAEAGKFPSLTLGSTGTRSSNLIGYLPGNSFNTSIKLNWPVYTGGRVEGLIDQAKIAASAADLDVSIAKEQVRLDATTAYYNVLQARNIVKVNQESVDNLNEHLKNVQAQYGVGTVAKADLLRSEVELANAQQNLTKAQSSFAVAAAGLNNTIGVPMDIQNVYKNDLNYVPYDVSLEDSITQAMNNRPEIVQSKDNIDAAQIGIKIADSDRKPTIALGAAEGWNGPDFPGQTNNWSMNVSASWNIFDAGLTNARVKEAGSVLDKAKAQDKQIRDGIEFDVRQAYLNMKEAEQRIQTSGVTVDKAVEDMKIAQTKYSAGAGTNLDVIDAQLALTQARTNYSQALYDYNTNKANLEKAIGLNEK